jgi:uncharacterized protein YgbK (DUF1537 family)
MTATDIRQRSLAELLAGLPPEPDAQALLPTLRDAVRSAARPLVAIDDDPTGVQTVYDTTVLLTWNEDEITSTLRDTTSVFFILTNSRSLPVAEAARINRDIGNRLTTARKAAGGGPLVVASRSDSTLRGHYPDEVLALQEGLGEEFDGHVIVPAFFEGGRYTIGDTHWVATPDARAETVVAASATSFAQDAVFGFRSSHLPTWVEEKSGGRWHAGQVRTISMEDVRAGPEVVCRKLMDVGGGTPVVVNSAGYGDLTAFVLGLLQAERAGKRFLYRTAASFMRIRAGLEPRPLLSVDDIFPAGFENERPGLVVVGSYQPSTTQQLERLLAATELRPQPLEVDVQAVLDGRWSAERFGADLGMALQRGGLPVLYTSRKLLTGTGDENLAIGRSVTDALLAALQHLEVRPGFIIAKGGITSHEVAHRGLGAERATVLGQLQPGVPVWRLESGPGLRFADMPYVVFPGNVGSADSLVDAARTLSRH